MAAASLHNSTFATSLNTRSTSTSTYGFPSSSFVPHHQKQSSMPNMPIDQKQKLLQMHKDGKANAGLYVAVVLFVYFILVILLLCRYGRRRRTTDTSTDSSAEQGRLNLLSFHLSKIVPCGKQVECCSNCCFFHCFSPTCHQITDDGECGKQVQSLEEFGKPEQVKSVSVLLTKRESCDQVKSKELEERTDVDMTGLKESDDLGINKDQLKSMKKIESEENESAEDD